MKSPSPFTRMRPLALGVLFCLLAGVALAFNPPVLTARPYMGTPPGTTGYVVANPNARSLFVTVTYLIVRGQGNQATTTTKSFNVKPGKSVYVGFGGVQADGTRTSLAISAWHLSN